MTIPISVAVVLFALSNRQDVTLSLWPLPDDLTLDVPVFLVALVPLVAGILLGGLIAWASGARHRRLARRRGRRIAKVEAELAEMRVRHGAMTETVREQAESARRRAASQAITAPPQRETVAATVQLAKPAPAAAAAH